MAQNLLIEIQIQDNQVRAKIDGLQNSFDTLENTIKTAKNALAEMNATSQGTVKGYSEQIRALEELRDKTAKTNEQYRAQTEEIQKLKDAQNAISGPMKGSVGDLMQQRNALIAQQKATSRTAQEFNKYQKRIIEVQGKIDVLSGSTIKNVKVNEDLISNAGLAGATLTEVGRTLSDLPYGIRGVANNLSQLSTLFVTLISKTDSAKNAFALLGNQLKGPLGLILAFQAVLAALDYFAGSTKKAEEATDDLSDAIATQTQRLKELAYQEGQIEYIRRRNGVVIKRRIKETGEELRNTVEVLRTEFSEFNKMFENLTDLSDESVNQLINDFRTLLQNQETQTKVEKALVENRKKGIDAEGKVLHERNKLQKSLNKIILESNEIRKKYSQDAIDFTEQEIEVTDDLTQANKEFFQSLKDIEELRQLLDKTLLIPELREDAFDADQFIDQIVDFNRFRTQFTSLTESQIIDIQEQSALEQFGILTQGLENVIDIETEKQKILDFFAQKRKELRNSELQQALSEVQELINGMSDTMAMLSDAELSREERKTTMLNNELKERLRNENLSAKEREKINKQIEANELALQKRRDEIAERNFRLQKAFAIAQAAINTALAVSDVLRREEGGFIKKSIAAIAIGVLGAAQIAAIASTKFVPTATSVPSGAGGISGGGAGAPAQQEPVFNIVGTGTQMQLAETVAQRTGEPVKAFVVSNDITTAQELDRNIITGSAIG
jgi:DNA repair exonuclease SbcCD ATPase subunit